MSATRPPAPQQIERSLLRLNLARQDFLGVKALSEKLIQDSVDPRHFIFRPYMAGIVTTYSRGFGQNDGIGPLGGAFSKFTDETLRDTHVKLLRLRDKAYAHRDALAGPSFTSSKRGGDNCYKLQVRIEDRGTVSLCSNAPELNPENLPNVVALCVLQSRRADEAVVKLLRAVMNGKTYQPGTYTYGSGFP